MFAANCRTGLAVVVAFLLGLGAAPVMGQSAGKGGGGKAASMFEKVAKAVPEAAPAKPKRPRKLLVYSRTDGPRHTAIEITVKALTMMGDQTGAYTVLATENPEIFIPEKLNMFDGVMMVNTTGQFLRPLANTVDAKNALARHELYKTSLLEFVRSGKGLMGIHAASAGYKDNSWPEWAEVLGGGFLSHPWTRLVPVKLAEPNHPLVAGFEGKDFEITDELYQFRLNTANPAKIRVLLQMDISKFPDASKGNRGPEGPYYQSWIQNYGQGRVFYCVFGHREEHMWNPPLLKHYLAGIQFALGDLQADSSPSQKAALQ